MTGFDIIEEVEERVILVGVSTGEGDDTAQSLDELEELAKTARGSDGRTCDPEQRTDSSGYLYWYRKDCRSTAAGL